MDRTFIKNAFLIATLFGAPSCAEEPDTDVQAQDDLTTPSDEPAENGAVLDQEDQLTAAEDSTFVRGETDIGPVVTASAASCPAGAFCLWQDTGFNGRMLVFRDAGCQNLGPFGFNDEMSSWYNRRGANYRVYWDANCRGAKFTASDGSRSSSVGGWNDEASSICRGAGCP